MLKTKLHDKYDVFDQIVVKFGNKEEKRKNVLNEHLGLVLN
jgi:hypothetical protein